MYLEKLEEVSQRVGDHAAQLERHDGGDAGEELLRQLGGVGVLGRHQVLPVLALLPEQLGARRDPAATTPRACARASLFATVFLTLKS